MVVKATHHSTDSPRAEIGEIDTRAPFESVKAAVSLFGEAAFSGSGEKLLAKKSKPFLTERVLAKETQLHLAQKELNKFKEQLKIAETTKTQALSELEKAKKTVEDLTNKLKTINDSKESAINAIKATEAAKDQTKQLKEDNSGDPADSGATWKQELDVAKKDYTAAIDELNTAKQELTKIRQDFEASMGAKVAAVQQAAEAEHLAKVNRERIDEISNEISSAEESIVDTKFAYKQAQQEHAKILSEKDAQRQSYRASLEEAKTKLESFKTEFGPQLNENVEAKLAETTAEIGFLQKEIDNARASDLDSVKSVTLELDDAKDTLHKIAEEESTLRSLVESLKLEIENVKKEHSELKEKEAETESIAGNLHVQLRKSKAELEAALNEESKITGATEELVTTLQQLSLESESAEEEAEEMKRNAEELRKEAETIKISLEEAEKKLQIALQEAEEARSAEAEALDQIKILSERTTAVRASTSESGSQITISAEEFESLNRKVGESDKLAEMKIAAAMAQVDAVKASEHEAQTKLETSWKEIVELKSATDDALKRAEMAEAAKKAVEGELRRWREREQKRAAETAARILAESEMSSAPSPQHIPVQMQMPSDHKPPVTRKMDKSSGSKKAMDKSSGSKKALLSNLSGIFYRKKNQVKGGGSPSYLPGEKPL